MPNEYNKGSHTIYDIKYHIIWVTKYRYKMLTGRIAERLRELIRQGCEARGIVIIQGSVGKDHVHLLLSSKPSLAPSKIVQYLKGRSSRLLQDEFQELKKGIGDNIYGQEDIFVRQSAASLRKQYANILKSKTSVKTIISSGSCELKEQSKIRPHLQRQTSRVGVSN